MSGPSTEEPAPGRPAPLSWSQARDLAELHEDALGVVPDYLARYLTTGDEAELARPRLPHDPGG